MSSANLGETTVRTRWPTAVLDIAPTTEAARLERLEELNRLLEEVRRVATAPATPRTMARMGAVVHRALRVTSDIAF
jgi:hypothetical protein